uniref:Uncharacterized protein n=1 Tax=Trichuris muris TaxID=70415 RepID=A0A5S6Q4P0_TRIMR
MLFTLVFLLGFLISTPVINATEEPPAEVAEEEEEEELAEGDGGDQVDEPEQKPTTPSPKGQPSPKPQPQAAPAPTATSAPKGNGVKMFAQKVGKGVVKGSKFAFKKTQQAAKATGKQIGKATKTVKAKVAKK